MRRVINEVRLLVPLSPLVMTSSVSMRRHRVPWDSGHIGILLRGWFALHLRWRRLSLYRSVFLSEFRSLIPRTKYRMRKNLDTNGVDLGTCYQKLPSGHLALNTRAQARIGDMQHWLSSFPAATLVDLQIFLAGWDKGAESQLPRPEPYSPHKRETVPIPS